jgi:alpha(1,3/1,4) fucosyltransferase
MIKIYKASSFKYTPFDNFVEGDLDFLKENNIVITDNVKNADIIISQNFKHLKPYFWRHFFGKKFLVWTMEPKFDMFPSHKRSVFFGLINCFVMNVYTKDVHVSSFSFRTAGLIDKEISYVPDSFQLKSKKIIALMSYYNGGNTKPLIVNDINVDLISLRSKIGLSGSKISAIDIYGKGWPDGISKEDSRDGDWGKSKKMLLKEYNFNLCFENTIAYNYVSEKIWDSIKNYCLPIYYGKNTNIYEIFPHNSFIDYSEFESPEQLFDFVNQLTDEEFVRRINLCIKVYNNIQKKGYDFILNERLKMLNQIVLKVNHIVLC